MLESVEATENVKTKIKIPFYCTSLNYLQSEVLANGGRWDITLDEGNTSELFQLCVVEGPDVENGGIRLF